MTEPSARTDGTRTGGDGDVDDQITITASAPGPGQVVLAVGGEVDMVTAPQLQSTVLDRFSTDGTELVVLALDDVTFLGTSGLAALIELRDTAHRTGTELRVACSTRRVLRPLTIAGLLPLFDVHDTLEQALAAT